MAQPAGSEGGPAASWGDERVELVLANVLRAGVMLAASLVLTGGVMYLSRHGGGHPDYGRFVAEPGTLNHPIRVLRAALAGESLGIIQLGVLILIATPVLRVAFSLVAFARERDRIYIALTALVLGILLLSLFGVLP
jgi:uncharacterized membrane protein